jgi:hypothetical protein
VYSNSSHYTAGTNNNLAKQRSYKRLRTGSSKRYRKNNNDHHYYRNKNTNGAGAELKGKDNTRLFNMPNLGIKTKLQQKNTRIAS